MKRMTIAVMLVLGLGFNAGAAWLYWDGSDSTADADGGSGTWSTSIQNWDTAATNGSPSAWISSSDASFGGTAGVVTLGEAITTGTVFFDVPGYEIATAGNNMTLGALAGAGNFTKSGAGTLQVNDQGGYSGKITVSGGMLRAGKSWDVFGNDTAVDKLTVASGATFDVAGYWDMNIGLTLAGTGTAGQGAYINSGADTGDFHVQIPNIALAADATIGGSGNFYMIAGGHNPNTLTLNGHTLTKVGQNTFCMDNTTVSAGNVHIVEGGFGVIQRDANANAAAFLLDDAAGVSLVINGTQSLSVGSLAGGGAAGGNVSLGGGALIVGALNTSTLFAGSISGSGELAKDGSGTLTLTGASDYTGATRVWGGKLNLAGSLTSPIIVDIGNISGTGSTTELLTLSGGAIALPGGMTTHSLTADGVTFSKPTRVTFEAAPISGTTYDILNYGSGAVSNLYNLSVSYRGFMTDDHANHKLTFTATADGFNTRSWNTTTGTWDVGATANWLEDDHLFYSGDHVIFGNIASNSVVTLSSALYPNSITVNNAANEYLFQDGAIAGTTGLTKSGAGTLLISNENSYVGSTIVSDGTLIIGNKFALGDHMSSQPTKVVVTPGGTVDFNGVIDAVYGYTIAGSGVGGAGALVNTGNTIDNGKAQSTNIRLASNATIGGTSDWALLTFSYAPTRLDLAGHTLTKTGINTICLCNTTISTGTIQIASGTLAQTGPGIADGTQTTFVLNDSPNTTLALYGVDLAIGALAGGGDNGARVALDGNTLTVGSLNTSNSFSGVISGSGSLIKTGTNVWVIAGKNYGFTGQVIVNGGILKLGCGGPSSPNGYAVLGDENMGLNKVTVAAGATLDLAGFENTWYGFTLAGAGESGQGALVNTGVDMSFNNVQTPHIGLAADATVGGAGDFNMIGPGYGPTTLTLNEHTLTKSGANTFYLINTTVSTGSVHIAEGAIALYSSASDASAAAFTLADNPSAALALNNQWFSVGSLAGGGVTGGKISLGTGTLTITGLNTATDYAGQISGSSGSLGKSGNGIQTLSGVNNYTGATTISGGALLVNGSHTGGNGYVVTSGAALGGTGMVTLTSGTVDLQANATLAPGAAANAGGTLTLSSLTMAPTAKLAIDSPSDRVVVGGNLTLDNTFVTISNTNLFSTAGGSAYPILTCNGIVTGKFEPHVEDTRWIVKRAGTTFYLRYNYPGTFLLVR